ncbi:MAG: hypothetical protein AAF196_03625 [Planctomycetota bacterium]
MIEVHCEHCGRRFEAPKQLAGGITNCPHCGRATPVEGLRDPFWRLLQAAVLAGAAILGVILWQTHGVAIGVASGLGAAALGWLAFKIGG